MTVRVKNTAMMALLAGVMALPLAAQAETPSGAAPGAMTLRQVFEAVDADKSGAIDKTEYDAFAQAQKDANIGLAYSFEELNKSKSGELTIAEFSQQKPVQR